MFNWYKITIWSRWNKNKKQWEHNHIENEWITNDEPQGHPSWKSGTWMKKHGWLNYKNQVQLSQIQLSVIKPIAAILIIFLIWFGVLCLK